MYSRRSQGGQTLLELVTVVAVLVLVVGALVFATIASLRNANFASNQARATKLAQEGIEKVRGMRSRNSQVNNARGAGLNGFFNDLWKISLQCPANCYFFFNAAGTLTGTSSPMYEPIPPNFRRQIKIEDYGADPAKQKKLTVIVKWLDPSGEHNSTQITFLRNVNP